MKIAGWASAALLLLAGAHALLKYSPSGLFSYAWTTLLFTAVLAALYGTGKRLASLFSLQFDQEPALETTVAFSLGLAALTCSMLALGAAQLLYPAAAALLLGAFLWYGREHISGLRLDFGKLREQPLIIASCVLLGVAAVSALAPVHEYDSLVYHMALPQNYIQRHGLVFLPEVYAHFPQNAELLFTFSLLLQSPELAQLFGVLSLGLACLWLYSAPGFSPRAKTLAVFLTVSHTALLLLASTTYVECEVALWTTAALLSFLRWKDTEDPARAKPWIVLCAIFCGMGLGTKYYSGITPVILCFMGLYKSMGMGWFSQKKTRVLHMALFCAIWAALFAPWALKNLLSIGNPVFPFLHWVFSPAAHNFGVDEASRYFGILSEYGNKGGFLREFFSFPYLAFANPGRYGGGMDVLGSLGWELLFAGLPLILLSAWKNPDRRWAAFYLLAHWLVWMATGRVLRFMTVLAPLASLLLADGFRLLWEQNGRALKTALASALVLLSGARLFLYCNVKYVFGAGGVLCGTETAGEFLSRRLDYYPCADALNRAAGPDARVLIAGEQRSYYFKAQAVPTSINRKNDFPLLSNAASGPEELGRKLKEQGYTHVLFVPGEFRRLSPYDTMNFTRPGMLNWLALLKGSPVVYDSGKCYLHELR